MIVLAMPSAVRRSGVREKKYSGEKGVKKMSDLREPSDMEMQLLRFVNSLDKDLASVEQLLANNQVERALEQTRELRQDLAEMKRIARS
jgi:hypothetical protein